MKHIDAISCGQGAPSVYMILLAGEKKIAATHVIVADTGDENDMLWSNGKRTDARTYFEEVTRPLAEEFGLIAAFVRSVDKNKDPLPPLHETQHLATGDAPYNIDMPLFGNRGGRLKQSCTSKYKVAAVRQQLRRWGARTATTAIGFTISEVHRIKPDDVKWCTKTYPLVEHGIHRATAIQRLADLGIPYLITTECDKCPHKDWARWKRTSEGAIREAAEFEASFNGEFFLTSQRIPLLDALEEMGKEDRYQMALSACDSEYCFM